MVPGWLALGLAITAVLTVMFAILFAAGERLFPSASTGPTNGIDGEGKRRREIRAYLDAIGERYAEDHPVAGHTVAFYLPERDVAITFDGIAFFGLEDSPTYGILVEHEMPGAHLGARLPFETPEIDVGTDSGDSPVDVTDAFEVLGVSQSADEGEIRAAYRERVKDVHPDHGGDEETFKRVQEAYTTATRAVN